MLVKIEARILIFPGTDFHLPSTSVPPGMFLGSAMSVRSYRGKWDQLRDFLSYGVGMFVDPVDNILKILSDPLPWKKWMEIKKRKNAKRAVFYVYESNQGRQVLRTALC